MLKFKVTYSNKESKEVKINTLVFKGLAFYVEVEDGLKNPFFYMPSEVVHAVADTLLNEETLIFETNNYNVFVKEL